MLGGGLRQPGKPSREPRGAPSEPRTGAVERKVSPVCAMRRYENRHNYRTLLPAFASGHI